jgi:hypothetical protein
MKTITKKREQDEYLKNKTKKIYKSSRFFFFILFIIIITFSFFRYYFISFIYKNSLNKQSVDSVNVKSLLVQNHHLRLFSFIQVPLWPWNWCSDLSIATLFPTCSELVVGSEVLCCWPVGSNSSFPLGMYLP